jgi:hypothetical protein
MEVPVELRRPPSLPLDREVFPDHSSFSVLRETPVAFSCDYFKKLNGYKKNDETPALRRESVHLLRWCAGVPSQSHDLTMAWNHLMYIHLL